MEKEFEQRRTIKITITLDVPVGKEDFATGRIERRFDYYIKGDEAFGDYGVEFSEMDIEFGEEYQREIG